MVQLVTRQALDLKFLVRIQVPQPTHNYVSLDSYNYFNFNGHFGMAVFKERPRKIHS